MCRGAARLRLRNNISLEPEKLAYQVYALDIWFVVVPAAISLCFLRNSLSPPLYSFSLHSFSSIRIVSSPPSREWLHYSIFPSHIDTFAACARTAQEFSRHSSTAKRKIFTAMNFDLGLITHIKGFVERVNFCKVSKLLTTGTWIDLPARSKSRRGCDKGTTDWVKASPANLIILKWNKVFP